jgi:hypothetical protein
MAAPIPKPANGAAIIPAFSAEEGLFQAVPSSLSIFSGPLMVAT